MPDTLLSIDQGTTGTTVLCINTGGTITGRGYQAHRQYYPQPGWVEHDPEEIWTAVNTASRQALESARVQPEDLAGVGITNQRETVVLWNAHTGQPIDRAIVWQCRRTTDVCARMRQDGVEELVRDRTGLLLDPYFSAAKIAWLLDAGPGRREAAASGEILAGTIDTWLAWRMSGGRAHVTDTTNASRTSLLNLHTFAWDQTLLDLFGVPRGCLPEVRLPAAEFAEITEGPLRGSRLLGIAGDQQAALFGHRCCNPGQAKNTYGTGCFLLVHTGESCHIRTDGILTTAACSPTGSAAYAWEGSVFIGGAVVQWLRDELGILETAAQSEELALQAPDSGGVLFVPAFTGLGAPYWDPSARGAILGLTRGSSRAQIARAALESIAFQSAELVQTMDSGAPDIWQRQGLNVDGGATENQLLMQMQADLLGEPVLRARQAETTALGAAYLAGIGAGIWDNVNSIPPGAPPDRFEPRILPAERGRLLDRWKRAVAAARSFQF